jgi:hypothetical protein
MHPASRLPRRRAAIALGLGALLVIGLAPATAAAADFPAKDSRYHS